MVSVDDRLMESAWLKLARAVQHQRALARATREYHAAEPHTYVRTDNLQYRGPLIQIEWRLTVQVPQPQQWAVLFGDAVACLRAALDHAMWAAVTAHSGPPAKPTQVQFPIHTDPTKFRQQAARLQALVAADVWDTIERVQPYHAGAQAHTVPLEVLRWLSNVDKHRVLHTIACTAVDFGPTLINADPPIEAVEDWRHQGPAENGQVLVRLTLRRPQISMPIDVYPTFAQLSTVQISDTPVEYRTMGSAMDITRDVVAQVVIAMTHALGASVPTPEELDLGAEHEAVAAEFGGFLATVRSRDGEVRRLQLPKP